jgi:hypothetical protein
MCLCQRVAKWLLLAHSLPSMSLSLLLCEHHARQACKYPVNPVKIATRTFCRLCFNLRLQQLKIQLLHQGCLQKIVA